MYPLGNQAGYVGESARAIQTIAKDPQRITIPMSLDEQQAAIGKLHQVISELEARMAAVLQHDAPTGIGEKDGPESPQILDRIARNTRGVGMAIDRVGDLLRRLHL